MGYGKGRMLLLAAELPFHRIIGVEFAPDLSSLAQKNLKTYRNARQACFQIEPVTMDTVRVSARTSVDLFFLPFDHFVMEPVIQNLNRSLSEHPRDVILVYANPVLADVVEAASNLRVYAKANYFGSPYIIDRSVV